MMTHFDPYTSVQNYIQQWTKYKIHIYSGIMVWAYPELVVDSHIDVTTELNDGQYHINMKGGHF